jgi:hypothetical protein
MQLDADPVAYGLASARSAMAVQYSVPSSSSQFFMNRPST